MLMIAIDRKQGKRTVFRLLLNGVEVFRSFKRAEVFEKQKEMLLAKAA